MLLVYLKNIAETYAPSFKMALLVSDIFMNILVESDEY